MSGAAIRRFWDWFKARADRVRENPGEHADEISEMLERVRQGLGWEMGGPKEGPLEFIVRTEAPELRFATAEIVAAAPAMKGWIFSSWRPPMKDLDFRIRMNEGPEFEIRKVSADLTDDERFPFLHAVVTSPDFSKDPTEEEKYAGYLALDAILGEQRVEDAFDVVEFRRSPAGRVPAEGLREEVARRLEALRSRPAAPATDQWAALRGKRNGKPWMALVASGLGSSALLARPWRVDVALKLKEPLADGMVGAEELEALRPLEDRLVGLLEARKDVVWTHRTHDGERTTSFYAASPSGLEETLSAAVRDGGYPGSVEINYDSRWRMYRDFLPSSP